jgi:hypothetical protein
MAEAFALTVLTLSLGLAMIASVFTEVTQPQTAASSVTDSVAPFEESASDREVRATRVVRELMMTYVSAIETVDKAIQSRVQLIFWAQVMGLLGLVFLVVGILLPWLGTLLRIARIV